MFPRPALVRLPAAIMSGEVPRSDGGHFPPAGSVLGEGVVQLTCRSGTVSLKRARGRRRTRKFRAARGDVVAHDVWVIGLPMSEVLAAASSSTCSSSRSAGRCGSPAAFGEKLIRGQGPSSKATARRARREVTASPAEPRCHRGPAASRPRVLPDSNPAHRPEAISPPAMTLPERFHPGPPHVLQATFGVRPAHAQRTVSIRRESRSATFVHRVRPLRPEAQGEPRASSSPGSARRSPGPPRVGEPALGRRRDERFGGPGRLGGRRERARRDRGLRERSSVTTTAEQADPGRPPPP